MDQDVYTISELNQFIKDVVNAGFPQAIWICGEIQGFNRNKDKKHVFFDLVEKDNKSQEIKARIGLVIFSNRKDLIEETLKQSGNPFSLKDDIEVKFAAKVDFYAPHGAVRLIVENIDPVFTLGKLAQEKQRLIASLKKKGTLDKNKQLTLPTIALNIGLITAYDSAAYNDFLSEIEKSGYGFQIFLRNTLMQGKKAEADVVQAIRELNKINTIEIIVITRGGGSIADLSCFDSEAIAVEIAQSRLPIFSGIGHEINITITDMAAHTYAKTPTAIAQQLVKSIEDFLNRMDELKEQLINIMTYRVENEIHRLKYLSIDLQNSTLSFLKEHNEHIVRLKEVLKQKPAVLLKDMQKNLSCQKDQVRDALKMRFKNDNLKIANYKKIIDVVHPANTLKRGFSISRTKNGKVLKSIRSIRESEVMSTELLDGLIESEVKSRKKGDKRG